MSIVYATQPGASGATLVFDGSAESRAFGYYSDSLWRYFATGTNPATDSGVGWKTSANTIDPWVYTYSAYNLTGGSGNDVFTAQMLGPGDDTLNGGAGDDSITGTAAGHDSLDGGTGNDTLTWSWATSAPLNLGMAGTVHNLGGTSFTGFETYNLALGSGNDTLSFQGMGGPVSGSFSTGVGDDTVLLDHTSTGSISLFTGAGTDTLIADFSQSSRVTLLTISDPPYANHPSLLFTLSTPEGVSALLGVRSSFWTWDRETPEILRLTLSAGNDDLGSLGDLSGARAAYIQAGDGNDTLSGTGGDDVLDGGAGSDTVYLYVAPGAPIDLRLTTPQRTAYGYDTLLNIENLYNQAYVSAWFIGNDASNRLVGGYLDDRLEGLAGNDALYGGSGNDTLLGGPGDDTLSGDDGNDILAVGPGTNSAAGGTGIDMLVIPGLRRAGSFTLESDGTTTQGGMTLTSLKGVVTNAAGTTTYTGIESFSFTDGRLVTDPSDPAMQIARMFHGALLRAPDPMSLNYWIDQRNAGVSIERIGDSFASSLEFAIAHGSQTNTQFVSSLFTDILGRAPDAALTTWVNALNSGVSRGTVLARFSESTEYKTRFGSDIASSVWDQDEGAASIARLYQATIGRHPEEYGLMSWRGRMDDGLSLYDIVPGFLNSAEFQAIYGNATSNADFVNLLYHNVLGRGPDAEGFAHWTSHLDQGIENRVQVVIGFSESLEFRLNTMSWIEGGIVLA